MSVRRGRAVPRARQILLVAVFAIALGVEPLPTTAGPAPATQPGVGIADVAAPVAPRPDRAPPAIADPANPPGTTELVSVASDGTQGNAASGGITATWSFARPGQAISADGRWVAFTSDADNLVPGDTNRATDVFLRDRQTGQTTRLPYLNGAQFFSARISFRASEPSISADGSVIAFTLDLATAGTTDAPTSRVLVWSRATNTTVLGSFDLNGRATQGWQPSVSADGRFVAYSAWNIGDTGTSQVVIRELATGAVTLVSHDATGSPGGLASSNPSVSADGSYVAFESNSSLLPGDGDGNELSDIYLFSRADNSVTRVSINATGGDANGESHEPSISGDGSVVAFTTSATNLTPDAGQSPRLYQVFVWERATGLDRLVSVGLTGAAGTGVSAYPSVSLDGHVVGFDSSAPDLVPNDTNAPATTAPTTGLAVIPAAFYDVFLRDLVRNATIRVSVDGAGGQVQGDSRRPSVSGDGRTTAFDSTATTLVASDANQQRDVFVRDLPPVAQVTPNPVTFGTVPLGTPSVPIPVTETNAGWGPLVVSTATLGGPNVSDFAEAGDTCTGATLRLTNSCTIAIFFTPLAPGARNGTLTITDNAVGSPRTVRLIGNAGGLALTLDPPVGPPGFVTIAVGSGFPPGALVALSWDRGINAKTDPVPVGPDGQFRVGVLVFYNDVEGSRNLAATSAGGAKFPKTTAPFLVVVPSAQPPAFGVIRYKAPGIEPIIIRR